MIVTARAGTTVEDLHTHLKEHGQRTSLPDRGGTIGGAIAVGENDLNVLGKGRVRDAVLQIRYISADGEIVSSGAPVVKNVSGFNLHKLLVGSFGTLGLIAEVTLANKSSTSRKHVANGSYHRSDKIFDSLYKPAAILWDGKQSGCSLKDINQMLKNSKKHCRKLETLNKLKEGQNYPNTGGRYPQQIYTRSVTTKPAALSLPLELVPYGLNIRNHYEHLIGGTKLLRSVSNNSLIPRTG